MKNLAERVATLVADFKAEFPSRAEASPLSEPEQKVVAAWRSLPIDYVEPLFLGGIPQHAHNRWAYLWKFRKIDWNELARLAGITEQQELRSAFEKLVSRRIIFPDGTAATVAESPK